MRPGWGSRGLPQAIHGADAALARIHTTMDIYRQFVPSSQRRALTKLSEMRASNVSDWDELGTVRDLPGTQVFENLVELVGIEPTTSSLRTMRSPSAFIF